MLIDAIVLSGGRSSRLGYVPKAELIFEHETLLRRTLAAAAPARRIVVVGPSPYAPLDAGILITREHPLFGGPAAGIAAGMTVLGQASGAVADAVLVLACDMPHVYGAVPVLVAALADNPAVDGVISVGEDERLQPLAACYRTAKLAAAVAEAQQQGSIDSLSVFRLVGALKLQPARVPAKTTADVDTWTDAERLDVSAPAGLSALPAAKRQSRQWAAGDPGFGAPGRGFTAG